MIKILQRKNDNKYLKSVETNTWVDDASEALEMTFIECNNAKSSLLGYASDDLKEIINFNKVKTVSREEKKELRNLLK